MAESELRDADTTANGLGALRERFTVDAKDQRALAFVRTTLACLAFAAASALLLSRVPVAIFGVALVGLLVPFVWLRQARVARKRAAHPPSYALTIFADGLTVSEGSALTVLRWREVSHIDVDEERLDILVKLREGPALRIEPRYPGVAIDELVRRLSAARDDALRSL